MTCTRLALATASLAVTAALAQPASAKDICGWYAIAYCTDNEAAASDFAGRGWGSAIATDVLKGFRPGLFCVVSGPQSKASAWRDRNAAIAQGVAGDVYIKHACADEATIGD